MNLFVRHPIWSLGLLPILAVVLGLWQLPLISLVQRQAGLRLFLQGLVSTELNFEQGSPTAVSAAAVTYLRQAGRQLDTSRPLGVMALAAGQLAEAENYFQARLQTRPDDALAHFFLGEVYRRRGETAAVIVQWEQAGAAPYLVEFAQNLLKQGAQADALAVLAAVIRLDPLNIEARRLAGDAWRKQGDMDQALEWYQEITAVAPEDPSGYERIAQLLFERKYYQEAGLFYRQALVHSPEPSPGLWVMLGRSYAALGQWPEAAAAYQQALTLEPSRRDPYLLLAGAKCRLGLPAEAALFYDQALQLDPAASQALQAGAYIRQHGVCPPPK